MPGAIAPFPACTPDVHNDKLTFNSTFGLFKQSLTIWNENISFRRGAGGSVLHTLQQDVQLYK